MTIAETLSVRLKEAMKARDADTVSCLRQVRSKLQEAENAPGYEGEMTDALAQQIIGAYGKSLQKAITEMGTGEGRAAELREKYQKEVDYLAQYMPTLLDEAATRKIVADIISAQSITDPKQSGRVIGAVMKSHKGEVDPGLVKRLATELLGG